MMVPSSVDQHRIGPAPLPDRGRDLVDLLVAVRAGVAGIRDQPADRPALHLVCGPFVHLFASPIANANYVVLREIMAIPNNCVALRCRSLA